MLVTLVLATVCLSGLVLLSMGGIVGGPRSTWGDEQIVEIRFHSAQMILQVEPWQVANALSRSGPTDEFSVPGLFRYSRHRFFLVDPATIQQHMGRTVQALSSTTQPANLPPEIASGGWYLAIHLWPLVLLAGFHPVAVFVRFMRSRHPRNQRTSLLAVCTAGLFTVVSLLSLLACIGAGVVWMLSAWPYCSMCDTTYSGAGNALIGRTWLFGAAHGRVGLGRLTSRHTSARAQAWDEHVQLCSEVYRKHWGPVVMMPASRVGRWFRVGFDSGGATVGGPVQAHWLVGLPCWYPLVATAILPACWIRWFQRRRRSIARFRKRQCLECGYNLTGNVSGVCPECGTAMPERAVSNQRSAVSNPRSTVRDPDPGRSIDGAEVGPEDHTTERKNLYT
ncbi:MAG: hypothetical protein AMXMBFR13_34840 [Phycisphaerae bacterium]